MVRRIAVLAIFLFAMLGVPRTGHAAWFEFIWEMSGPRMIGAGSSCLYSLELKLYECRVGAGLAAMADHPHRPLLVIGGSGFVSVPHESDTQKYGWFDANMLAFEPGVLVLSRLEGASGGLRIGHGAGISYDVLFGRNFGTFDKFGFIITPVEVTYGKFVLAAKVRIYPNGFTDDEFGFGPRANYNRPAEAIYGGSVSYIWR